MKNMSRILALLLVVAMLAVPVAATENFTPSVEQKGAPIIVDTPAEDGEGEAGLLVYDEDGEIVAVAPIDGIRITPYADRETAGEVIEHEMDDAYDAIAEADSLLELVSTLEDTLLETLAKMEAEGHSPEGAVTVSDLIVRDIFNVGLDDETRMIVGTGETVGITFDLKVPQNDVIIVLRYVHTDDLHEDMGLVMEEKGWFANLWDTITGQKQEGMIWLPVKPELVEINEDGTVTVRLDLINDDIGTIAFVTQRSED